MLKSPLQKLIQIRFSSTLDNPIKPSNPKKPSFFTKFSGEFAQLAKGGKQLFVATGKVIEMWTNVKDTGKVTTRPEIRLVMRVKQDWMKIIPAVGYFLLPFTIPTLPLIVKYFPGFLPSCFVTDSLQKIKLETVCKKRVESSRSGLDEFTTYLDQLNLQNKDISFADLKSSNDIKPVDWVEVVPFMNEYCNIKNSPLKKMSAFVGISMPSIWGRPRFLQWADWILKDNQLIKDQGIQSLSNYELVEALLERGFKLFHIGFAFKMPREGDVVEMRRSLSSYVDLIQTVKKFENVPVETSGIILALHQMHQTQIKTIT